MSLHCEKTNTSRLDTLAREVLAESIRFERARSDASRYASSDADALCSKVAAYREALYEEVIGTTTGAGGTREVTT
jgi:hypothetical protein